MLITLRSLARGRGGRRLIITESAAAAAERTPLYYQDPAGKPDYSPTPKKDAEGRDYVPVYDEPGAAPPSAGRAAHPAGRAASARSLLPQSHGPARHLAGAEEGFHGHGLHPGL